MLLELTGVGKTYRTADHEVVALKDVSLAMDDGAFTAIRGPSGCGKSTLLLTCGTLLAPDTGDVVINGERPYTMSGDRRAAFRGGQLGFVFQQFHLVPYLTVWENVLAPSLALAGTPAAMDGPAARARADELLERFGLGHRREHTPGKLSSGERQRCALARALLNGPRLLLADEPTGNLDHENAQAVLSAMREFAAAGGAVLLVTHDDRAAEAADETYWMREGSLQPLQESVS